MAKPPPPKAEKPAPKVAPSPKPAARTKPAPARTRLVPSFIAVVLMAAVVGLLIWTKPAWQARPTVAEDQAAVAREARIAAIDQRLAAIEAALDGALDAAAAARLALDATAANRLEALDQRLANRLEALDQRLAALEARPAATTPEQADLGPLEDQLASIEQALESGGEAVAAAGDVAADFAARIAALEARPVIANTAPPPAATLLATAQLRTALGGSGPYEAPLAALESLGGEGVEEAIAVLAPHAAAGIATPEMLRDRFAALAGEILRSAVVPAEGSWINRTLARLSGLVTVRRVGGDIAGLSTEAIVARAEARLMSGDLAAAVGEVAALDGGPADVAAAWLAQARARLAADAAVAALDARTIAVLGGS